MSTMQNHTVDFNMSTFEGRRAHAHSVMLRVAALEQPFDIYSWVENRYEAYDCGTAACAIGWIARTEEARALGFHLRGNQIYCEGVAGFPAVAQYFAIKRHDAELLFSTFGYNKKDGEVTALDVAARMEEMGWATPL